MLFQFTPLCEGRQQNCTKSDVTEKCAVKKRKSENEYDFEDIRTMWGIQLESGEELNTFFDELEECEK